MNYKWTRKVLFDEVERRRNQRHHHGVRLNQPAAFNEVCWNLSYKEDGMWKKSTFHIRNYPQYKGEWTRVNHPVLAAKSKIWDYVIYESHSYIEATYPLLPKAKQRTIELHEEDQASKRIAEKIRTELFR